MHDPCTKMTRFCMLHVCAALLDEVEVKTPQRGEKTPPRPRSQQKSRASFLRCLEGCFERVLLG